MTRSGRLPRTLSQRLFAAGVEQSPDPFTTWKRLREVEGTRTTVIDLYELVAAPRGLAAHELPLEERLELGRRMLPVVWPGWAINPGSARNDPIELVGYDTA